MTNILQKIETDKAPAAIGPYSQAVIIGELLYTSGQVPIIPETGAVLEGDILAQTALVCENLGAILAAAGTDFGKVIKTTCFLADMADFAAFNSVYEKYFTEKPARSCVAVKGLPRDVLCEVEAIAYLQK
ncbi:MAG: RidA family protein [Lachnospiraceae bacterium]|nr:RidA family protein [Lachnospiraceae bacterium]